MRRPALLSIPLVLLLAPVNALAGEGEEAPPPEAAPVEAEAAADPAAVNAMEDEAAQEELPFEVHAGPMEADLGVASLQVPEGFGFIAREDMDAFNESTGNLPQPQDVGALVSEDGWIVFFNWDDSGYVPDDDKDELDADAILESLRKGQERANERRAEAGMNRLVIEGWEQPPYYDEATHNLTWALRNRAEGRDKSGVNHEVRLLGRRGAMSAILVGRPDEMGEAVPKLQSLLEGFDFHAGERYAEYREGDKLAEYGLTGLVLGGGALLALKGGLFAKLGKFAKFIIIGVVAAGGAAWRKLKGLFGRN